ncbi:MAG TPA: hypothetical protein EYP80_01740 [Candidatus Aenigmarchaeota archaeon]|nr:hypothetical protein [Candidatus Aenigmarchaeota archaeon]
MKDYFIDLGTMEGNYMIRSCLNDLINHSRKKEIMLFPGTLLEKREGYSTVTMPIICEGEIIGRRRKLTSLPYIDDWNETLKIYSNEDLSVNGSIILFEEPFKSIYDKIRNIQKFEALESIKNFEKDSHRILPIICNEIELIPKYYSKAPVDVIVHSSYNHFLNEKKRIIVIKKLLKNLKLLV